VARGTVYSNFTLAVIYFVPIMVQIQLQSASRADKEDRSSRYASFIALLLFGFIAYVTTCVSSSGLTKQRAPILVATKEAAPSCRNSSLSDLTDAERYPAAGIRHMVDPPRGGKVTLVCCQTTVGPMTMAVHHIWAPVGAAHFLELVQEGYFSSKVALMRCLKDFICQFGLAGTPELNKRYQNQRLDDDPNWLPEGPSHRMNEKGVKRFAKGYLAYAGGGKNSRSNQFIVSLVDEPFLAGGSPWEVPWGELVGVHSFETLGKIYTGYGEGGPPQGLLSKEGSSESVMQKWPLLDYITSCQVIDEAMIPPR